MEFLEKIKLVDKEVEKARNTIKTLENRKKLTKEEQSKLDAAREIDNRRRKIIAKLALVMGFVTLGSLYGISRSCEKEKSADGNIEDQGAEVATANNLFNRNERTVDIPRTALPEKLPELINGKGKVITPEEYDPNKANLYLIATSHIDPSNKQNAHLVQEECLRIFHDLYAIGVRKQYLEGVDSSIELTHDKVNPRLGENPVSALPEYKRRGKINRAYIAVEGIYGDKVKSLGTENESQYMEIKQRFLHALNFEFGAVLREIMLDLADKLKIDVSRERLADRRYVDAIREAVRNKVKTLSAKEIDSLIKEVVLENQAYKKFSSTVAERFFYRIQGRNAVYAEKINNQNANGGQDSAFIIGAQHVQDLRRKIKNTNVFIILPEHLESGAETPFFSDYTKEDYLKKVIEHDLSIFGLAEKPKEDLFD